MKNYNYTMNGRRSWTMYSEELRQSLFISFPNFLLRTVILLELKYSPIQQLITLKMFDIFNKDYKIQMGTIVIYKIPVITCTDGTPA